MVSRDWRFNLFKENVKGWDKVIGLLFGLFGPGMLLVAGFDERWGWSPRLAVAVQVAAFVFVALGDVLFAWAMASNKFFSSVVRIQQDRGHTVQTGGPYRFVRHPGYVGTIVPALATPLALGSLWALIPAGLLTAVTVVRTAMEDKTLRDELAGYEEYAQLLLFGVLVALRVENEEQTMLEQFGQVAGSRRLICSNMGLPKAARWKSVPAQDIWASSGSSARKEQHSKGWISART
jgi:protein-S-isoprenylcysteine O-methyltransferase Ste14